ncbi:hypothetical protein ACIPY6_33630 [Streptomyces sp. NPDC090054]|uniref:hypothetical protein n=1 Tax=Streptomyces sp. NPDC090054 TaxID=3365933 RepID=UPI0037FBB1F6
MSLPGAAPTAPGREHEVATETSIDQIARDLAIWMAARDFPGRPTQHSSHS